MSTTTFVQQKPMAISTITSPDPVSVSLLEPSSLSLPFVQSNSSSHRDSSYYMTPLHSPPYSASPKKLYTYYSTSMPISPTLCNNNNNNNNNNKTRRRKQAVLEEEEEGEVDDNDEEEEEESIDYSERSSPNPSFLSSTLINMNSSDSSTSSISSQDNNDNNNSNNCSNDTINHNISPNSSPSMNNSSPLSLQERRQRNKTASAKYRAKKNQQHQDMRCMINNLTKENDMLIRQLDQVKMENQQLKSICDKLRSKMMAEKMLKKLLQQQQLQSYPMVNHNNSNNKKDTSHFYHYQTTTSTSSSASRDIKLKENNLMDFMNEQEEDIDIDLMDDNSSNNNSFLFESQSVYNHHHHPWMPEQK